MSADPEAEVPGEVIALLADGVDSIEKLEVLMIAWQQSAVAWTDVQVAARLHMPQEAVGDALRELETRGLLIAVEGGGVRFGPVRAEDQEAADALCQLYAANRIRVLNIVTAQAMARIRRSAARAFADAFRITPVKKGDR